MKYYAEKNNGMTVYPRGNESYVSVFHKKFEMEQFAGNAVKGFFDKMCEEVEADAFS